MNSKPVISILKFLACTTALSAFITFPAQAQSTAQGVRRISPTAADDAAAANATIVYSHVKAARTAAGATAKQSDIAPRREALRAGTSRQASASVGGGVRFPGDLTYFGGAVVGTAESHPIYLLRNGDAACASAACWGDPETFLSDFGRSEAIHVVDQYTGQFSGNRYTLGGSTHISYTPPATPLTDANIRAVVHAVASATGEIGYGHIYHVFLPPGQDECFTASFRTCYSPDNQATWIFCAYHGSTDFQDIGHVLYSVEPFQNVEGCNVKPGTPNGQMADSTNSTLSHELIETITDPDGDAWFNFTSGALLGAEIADECVFVVFVPPSTLFSDPTPFRVQGRRYAVQPEYSNLVHACALGED